MHCNVTLYPILQALSSSLYDHLYDHYHIYKNKTFIDLLYQLLVDLLRHLGHLLVN